MQYLHWISVILLIAGGLNWGLVGLFDGYDLIAEIFGAGTTVTNVIYIAVGASAVYRLYDLFVTKK